MVVAPGTLYVTAATLAALLGQRGALDLGTLRAHLDAAAAQPATARGGTVLLVLTGFLAASAAAGLAAGAVGQLTQRVWTASGQAPVLRCLASARQRRWRTADAAVAAARRDLARQPEDPTVRARLRRAIAVRDAICLVPATRPTWVGDRLNATDTRVHDAYRLDLEATWPRLWLVLPDPARQEIAAAQAGCAAAARLGGWGLLYAPLAVFWWPAAMLAAATLLAARYRARQAVSVYANLVEAAVDLYARDVLTRLGVDCEQRVTPQAGAEATSLLRKDLSDRLS
jgi:hypothetical protein